MDNPSAPIASLPSQPEVSSLPVDLSAKALASAEALAKAGPAESSSRRWLLWSVIGLVLLALGAAIGLFSAKFLNQSSSPSQLTLTPSPSQPPTPTPDLYREPTGSAATADWNIFATEDKLISFKYPTNWTVKQHTSSEGWGKNITIADLRNNQFHLFIGVANAFMNECMRPISEQTISLSGTIFTKKHFKGVFFSGGEACSNKENVENLEIWLQPVNIEKEPYNYQYGLVLYYKLKDKTEAETTFDQILSTFKFLDK